MNFTPANTMTSWLRLGRLAAQLKGIAEEIGRQLHFLNLVIMGQDDGVLLFFQRQYLAVQVARFIHGFSPQDCSVFPWSGQT